MNRLITLSATLIVAASLHAQVSVRINAKPADLKSLARRTLVVELPEPNPKVIKGFPKKSAAADEAAYRASLESYRQQIEPAIKAYWKFNEDIEYKTTTEIIQLFEKKSKKYVALMKVVLPDGGGVSGYSFGMGVPALVLTRTDGDSKVTKKGELDLRNHDFQSYLVLSPSEDGKEIFNEASMKLTLLLCQQFLDWNIHNKKSRHFLEYLKDQSEAHCSKLAAKQLMVDKDRLYKKTTPAEISENYGRPVECVDLASLEAAYLEGSPDKAVLFSIPIGTISGGIGIGPLGYSFTRYAYSKVVVDASNSEVLNSIVPGTGKTYVEGLLPMDMRQLAKCK